jgi:hypothetical protein
MALAELTFGVLPTLVGRNLLMLNGRKIRQRFLPAEIHIDALDVISRAASSKRSLDLSKRRLLDISDLQDAVFGGEVESYRHIRGCTNPVDGGTKQLSETCQQVCRFNRMLHEGVYVPDFTKALDGHDKSQLLVTNHYICSLCKSNSCVN